jgi:hypothetical protein
VATGIQWVMTMKMNVKVDVKVNLAACIYAFGWVIWIVVTK